MKTIATLLLLSAGCVAQVTYYVAPNGSDSNNGSISAPFATEAKAESVIQSTFLNNCGAQSQPATVYFRAGTWYSQSMTMTSADSGCSANAPVIFSNYPGEVPVFSGGLQVTNWVNTSGSLWQATLPSNTANFEALFYNGVRRSRPRIGTGIQGSYLKVSNNISGFYDRFYYNPSDPITTSWKNYAPSTGNPCGQAAGNPSLQGDIEILIFEWWDISRERISCIDTVKHIIYLTGSTSKNSLHGYIPSHRYLVENVKDQLLLAGQWFLDRSVNGAWVLNYIANPGENPNVDTVVIPQRTPVFSAKGLKYRTFTGLTFSDDNYVTPTTGYAGSQADLLVPASTQCMDCSNVTFDADTWVNTTGYGLSMLTDDTSTATGNLIENNVLYDLGAGGIYTGHQPNGTETDADVFQFGTIEENIVQGYGRMFPGAAAITNQMSHDVVTQHNDVNDGYNQGIMICFPDESLKCKGTSASNGTFNQSVIYNHIWNLGQGILSDFGGIYFATYNGTGNIITNNKIHDISDSSALDTRGYGGNGLYVDRGGPITVTQNLTYRTSASSMQEGQGPYTPGQVIDITNNIFAYSRKAVIAMAKCAAPGYSQFAFSHNISYQDKTGTSNPSAAIQMGVTYPGTPVGSVQSFANDDYWNISENFATTSQAFSAMKSGCKSSTEYSFSSWQALGEDLGSVVQDPQFTSPAYPVDNYSFLGAPPTGFIPFNTSGNCPTCPGRTNPTVFPPAVPASFPTAPFNPATDF